MMSLINDRGLLPNFLNLPRTATAIGFYLDGNRFDGLNWYFFSPHLFANALFLRSNDKEFCLPEMRHFARTIAVVVSPKFFMGSFQPLNSLLHVLEDKIMGERRTEHVGLLLLHQKYK